MFSTSSLLYSTFDSEPIQIPDKIRYNRSNLSTDNQPIAAQQQ